MTDGMMDTQYLSQDKYESLKKEMMELKNDKIPVIAKRIDDARQMGDLSENAEYHSARDEMAWAQTRVKELENILRNYQVLSNQDNTRGGVVTIGSKVLVKSNKIEKEFTIVGAQEAEPLIGKISNESPLGRAFLGAKAGDEVDVNTPAGVQVYKILEVK